LTLEFDAVGSIPGHELSSFESPACRSNVKSTHVRPQGPTPNQGVTFPRRNTPFAISSAIFLILELNEPYSGLFKVPRGAMQQAFEALG
jgi:hypothetical protein